MGFYSKLRGTIETIFQFGTDRAAIRSQAGGSILEVRNSADSAFGILRAATPVDDNDVVTKKYADTLEKPIIVKAQADTSVSIPNNTAVRRFLVVTTAGNGAVIGDLLYDNGLNDANPMEILAAVEGRCMAVTDSLSGGTVTFEPDSIYIWDEDGTEWIKIGDIGSVTGAIRELRYVIDNSATQDSTAEMPANARVSECQVIITTQYSGGATITVGTTGDTDAFQVAGDNNPQKGGVPNIFSVPQDTDVGGSASVVRTTIAGAPAAGAGVVVVKFSTVLS